jgi:hypothetical protein
MAIPRFARLGEVKLARIPAKWNHFAEKDSRQINMLEQILIAKVFNFGGICSSHRGLPLGATVVQRAHASCTSTQENAMESAICCARAAALWQADPSGRDAAKAAGRLTSFGKPVRRRPGLLQVSRGFDIG